MVLGKLHWGLHPETSMWANLVILSFPIIHHNLAFSQSIEYFSAQTFIDEFKKELEILKKARESVSRKGDIYSLAMNTVEEKPVQTENREAIEAMAFEKYCLGKLLTSHFGIYSAFRKAQSLGISNEISKNVIDQLIQDQLECAPDNYPQSGKEIYE